MLERLLNHSADVAISGQPPADDRLVAEPLTDNEIVCIAAPDDPATAQARVEAAELADHRWLLREPGSGTRTLNEQFLANRGLEPVTLTLGSNGAIKQAAHAGLGVSLLVAGHGPGRAGIGVARRGQAQERAREAIVVRPALGRGPGAGAGRDVHSVRA